MEQEYSGKYFENLDAEYTFCAAIYRKYLNKHKRLEVEIRFFVKKRNKLAIELGRETLKNIKICINSLKNLKTEIGELKQILKEKEQKRALLIKNIKCSISRNKLKKEELKYLKLREYKNVLDDSIFEDEISLKEDISDIEVSEYEDYFQNFSKINLETISISKLENFSEIWKKIFEREIFVKKILFQKIDFYLNSLQTEQQIELNDLKDYYEALGFLKEKYKTNFNEIFDLARQSYLQVCDIFQLPAEFGERTKKNFVEMKKIIDDLSPKKEVFVQIIKKIYAREELKDKILEFEEKAKDPKRLFRNSKFLVEEEKFRKNCVPQIMNLENEIFQAVYEYEKKFDCKFKFQGKNYTKRLKKEIKERKYRFY